MSNIGIIDSLAVSELTTLTNSSVTATVSTNPLNQLPTTVTNFILNTELIRSSSNSTYSIGSLLNSNNSILFPNIDFTGVIGTNAKNIIINTIEIVSNNGIATTKLSPQILFFNTSNIGFSANDYLLFNPTYSQLKGNLTGSIDTFPTQISLGNNAIIYQYNELQRMSKTANDGKLYFSLITQSGYTPTPNESLNIIVKGFVL